MREIKFRAKSAITGSWIYGYFAIDQLGRNIIIDKYGIAVLVMAGTESQYIGLKDKNGKEIYEGDVFGREFKGFIVTYCGNQNESLGMAIGWYLQRDDFESWIELISRCNENNDNYEIIGNIYENPDLL